MSIDEIEHSPKKQKQGYIKMICYLFEVTSMRILLLQILLPLILRLLPMMKKSTLYSIIDSSIVPQNLIPSPKFCYQIGDYVVVKYNNS